MTELPYPPAGGSGPGGSFKGWEKITTPLVFYDPDTPPGDEPWTPVPPNERTIGISGEPDRDLGSEVEI